MSRIGRWLDGDGVVYGSVVGVHAICVVLGLVWPAWAPGLLLALGVANCIAFTVAFSEAGE